ncbi:AAA family ATPase [Pseudomonas sp. HR96]|uniref:ATP-binding protein n=1 Tax=Pseudomonas sp. HR96 TaxID=1027966 RepID=UPI002A7570A2|nr:AAA family ATPase [Pseudomonas sp. HR96]WPO98630.1 AAA family ATPase [Pseudomonas sp. HR96]
MNGQINSDRPVEQPLTTLLLHLEPLDQTLQARLEQVLAALPAGAVPTDVQRLLDELLPWVQQCFGIAQWRAELDLDAAAEHLHGSHDRVEQVVQRFALEPMERDLLLLCSLLALDGRYSTVLACLQMDLQKNQLSVECALSLLAEGLVAQAAARALLVPQGPLLRHGLLQLRSPPAGQAGASLLQIDPGVQAFLLGQDIAPLEWEACARLVTVPPQLSAELLLWSHGLAQDLAGEVTGAPPWLVLRGRGGDSRGEVLAHAAGRLGRAVLLLDLALLPEADTDAWALLLLVLREVRMRDAVLLLDAAHELKSERKILFARLCARLAQHTGAVASLSSLHQPATRLGERPHLVLALPERSARDDEALLRGRLAHWQAADDIDTASLVRRFSLDAHSLDGALHEAELYRRKRLAPALAAEDLNRALRLRAQQDFGTLAQRIEPRRGLADLVLDPPLAVQLQEILAAVQHRQQALTSGFAHKIAYGEGISALFFGDSGTGKTMAAEAIAHELQVDLIKIDLSTVVNKYIGETEKHLARVFDLAEQDCGVLFFDEADALFGKRSETKDAHDRHANIEVSYLLQRLENFNGLVILSTNNRANLDEAFNRRLTFATRFAQPDATSREQLWRTIWPTAAVLAADVDLAELARRYEITGANIRNAALLATWLAAQDHAPCIEARHLRRALHREMTKIGRIVL